MGNIRTTVAVTLLGSVIAHGVVFTEPSHHYLNPATVCIRLTIADQLSGAALNSAKEEAARIWERHGIVISWSEPTPQTCRTVVPIVFDARQLLAQGGKASREALGLTVVLGRSQTIYVSASRAFKMLSETSQFDKAVASQGERDYRGGVLIGRVIAHELGHVLLTSMAHSEKGLMRPMFRLRDVLSPDDATTDLSTSETNRLVMRFSLLPFEAPAAPPALARSEVAK